MFIADFSLQLLFAWNPPVHRDAVPIERRGKSAGRAEKAAHDQTS